MTTSSIEDVVIGVVTAIARTHRPALAQVAAGDALGEDLGFDSMDLAQAVAELEARLGTDPFATSVTIGSIRTVGDFVAAYRRAATG
jgi:acyl carrier protein